MNTIIQKEITDIEQNYHVKVLYAVEAGSRLWGYSSEASDYDVRFIYVADKKTYLSINKLEDTISKSQPDANIEYHGWDLFKAMNLFYRSNPSFFEWLTSPIVYIERSSNIDVLRKYMPEYYSLKKLGFHYLNLSRGNLKKEQPTVKDYIQALRGTLSVQWMIEQNKLPPLAVTELIQCVSLSENQRTTMINLLKERSKNTRGTIPDCVVKYLKEAMSNLEEGIKQLSDNQIPPELLNKLIWSELRIQES